MAAALAAVERRLADVQPAALARRDPAGTRSRLRALVDGLSGDLLRFADVLEQDRFAPDAAQQPLGPMAVPAR